MRVVRRDPSGITVRVVTTVYELPRPSSGRESDWLRFHHFDLAGASDLRLWAERERAGQALAALVCAGEDALLDCTGSTTTGVEWLSARVAYIDSVRFAGAVQG